MSFSAVAIPKMIREAQDYNSSFNGTRNGNVVLQVDLAVGSWIASLFFLGTVVGCLTGGLFNRLLGPRGAFLCCSPFVAASWLMIALADRLEIIFAARVLAGILFGTFQANGKVYNAEIAHPEMRGSLGAIIPAMASLGTLYTFLVGHFSESWRTVAYSQLASALLLGLATTIAPESPYWLVERGREEDAKKSLLRLRGVEYDVEKELREIVEKKMRKEQAGNRSVIKSILSKEFLLPFVKIGILMSLSQWAGINILSSYLVTVFEESGSSLDPSLAPIMVSAIQLVLSILSSFVLRFSPRKPLFLACASAICLGEAALATHHYLTRSLSDSESQHGWVPVLAITLVQSARIIGFMSIIQLLIAESFQTNIRSYASGICGAFTGLNQFVSTKIFPVLLSSIGLHGSFWIFSGVMLVGIIYAAFSIPENKNQSLVKTEEKMISYKSGNAQVNEAFEMNTDQRGI